MVCACLHLHLERAYVQPCHHVVRCPLSPSVCCHFNVECDDFLFPEYPYIWISKIPHTMQSGQASALMSHEPRAHKYSRSVCENTHTRTHTRTRRCIGASLFIHFISFTDFSCICLSAVKIHHDCTHCLQPTCRFGMGVPCKQVKFVSLGPCMLHTFLLFTYVLLLSRSDSSTQHLRPITRLAFA